MRLTLIVPGLARLERGALARSRALARLGAWSRARATGPGLAAAVLHALGAPAHGPGDELPVAPALARGAGLDAGDRYVLAAEPVSLAAGVDDVVVERVVDDLDAGDAARIVARLSAHFADDGLAFAAPRADAWFATATTAPRLATAPIDAVVGGRLSAHPPRGEDARAWQRWATEIQMMLHADPVNAARERAGRPPLNGLWFWGGGRARDLGLLAPFRAHAPGGRAGDLLRGLALEAGGEAMRVPAGYDAVAEAAPATRPAVHIAVALEPVHDAASLAARDAAWFAPAVDALARGRLVRIDLASEGVAWTARRPGRLARLRAALGGGGLRVPDA